ncbi:MAG: hypothetical protein HY537_13155, partial [Deltaproteobacteria bacterium]|nr:hypothetical protein [Deltaproteobacteria bacterium]
ALGNLSDNLTEFGYFAYVLRGEAKSRINLWSEAQQDFQKALELEPKAAVAHWAYANMLAKTQHRTEAVGELRSLLTYHPNYIPGIVSSRNY